MNSCTSNGIYSSMTLTDALAEEESGSHGEEGSVFDENDLLDSSTVDPVADQLAAAGPVGVAAAAAITSNKKRRRLHSFELNPSIRKRQQTRLLRKLYSLMEEYISRVGQQAVIVCCTPGKSPQPHVYRVFGSQPLEGIIRGHKSSIMSDLEVELSHLTPPVSDSNALYDMPPLTVDGLPTSLDKMTQAHLRGFIPEMLRFSTGKSKPGWGKAECRPVWWPEDVPWANVRSDVRDEMTKRTVSWTHALRKVVLNCYHHHGREDLLPEFQDGDPDGGDMDGEHLPEHYSQTLMQAINNPDGTMSLVEIDTGDIDCRPQFIQLADGSHARILRTLPPNMIKSEYGSGGGGDGVVFLAHQTSNHANQYISDDGHMILTSNGEAPGMLTLPANIYQSVMSGFGNQLSSSNGDGGGYQIIEADAELIGQDEEQIVQLEIQNSED